MVCHKKKWGFDNKSYAEKLHSRSPPFCFLFFLFRVFVGSCRGPDGGKICARCAQAIHVQVRTMFAKVGTSRSCWAKLCAKIIQTYPCYLLNILFRWISSFPKIDWTLLNARSCELSTWSIFEFLGLQWCNGGTGRFTAWHSPQRVSRCLM